MAGATRHTEIEVKLVHSRSAYVDQTVTDELYPYDCKISVLFCLANTITRVYMYTVQFYKKLLADGLHLARSMVRNHA